jgi:hypothetical protein
MWGYVGVHLGRIHNSLDHDMETLCVFSLRNRQRLKKFPCDAFGEKESFSTRDIWCHTAFIFCLIKANC